MKKTRKILLSLLMICSLFLTMNVVKAEEVPPVTEESSTKVINSIEEVKSFIPDEIALDIKDTDLFSDESRVAGDVLHEKVEPKIKDIFNENVEMVTETITGDSSSYTQENFYVGSTKMYYDYMIENLSNVIITVYERKEPDYYHCSSEEECAEKDIEKTVQLRKSIKIKYANSDKYNENNAKYVANAIKKVNFNKVNAIKENDDYDAVVKQYKEEIKKYLNDSSLEVYVAEESGGGDGDYSGLGVAVSIAKNGVIYETVSGGIYFFYVITIPNEIPENDTAYINYALPSIQKIWDRYTITGVKRFPDQIVTEYPTKLYNDGTFYKISLAGKDCEEGKDCYARVILRKENITKINDNIIIPNNSNMVINGTNIASDTPIYNEMLEFAKEKGYTNIFGAYELKLLAGSIQDKLTITFTLGNEYNGKKAIVLHKKSDGNYEEFVRTVENGSVNVEVTELSPFIVALSDEKTDVKKTNNVKTGGMNVTFYSVLSLSALLGMAYVVKKKRA